MSGDRDPFQFLMNIGESPEGYFLVLFPLIAALFVALVYVVVVYFTRKRDLAMLDQAIKEESQFETPDSVLITGPVTETSKPKPESSPKEIEGATAADAATEAPPKAAAEPEPAPEPEPEPDPVEATPSLIDEVRQTDQKSWLERLRKGLAKTRNSLTTSIGQMFTGKTKIDDDLLEDLHEALYRADVGVKTADTLVDHVRSELDSQDADWEQVRTLLQSKARSILGAVANPINMPSKSPQVILVVGVNGVGKTTTIGKLAAHFIAQDKSVLLAAADTFRAAAIEQLEVWGGRVGAGIIKHKEGSDPAAVAYDAVKAAIARNHDVLIVDTAGRLHNKKELMEELSKIKRVIGKDLPDAPHEVWLVLDATTGQNAVMQVKAFSEAVDLTGLVITKLDGTAKGGVVLGIADQFSLPIRFVGVGEQAADLRGFDATDFADSLF